MRREKISERMRLLQELVPGCNKVTDFFHPVACAFFCWEIDISETCLTMIGFCYLKITGKAVMLDEIINYVQSLQQQVEVSNFSSRYG